LKAFGRLIEEKVQPDHSIMEGMTVRPIDAEDLRATGSFLEICEVVFRKLLAQVETDYVELSYIAQVSFAYLSRYLLSKEPPRGNSVYALGICEVRRSDIVRGTLPRSEGKTPDP